MTIRRVFLLLVAPLFLLLAGVNGALLYVWERAEAEKGLEAQAIAAAVTVAAFADASGDLGRALADPQRAKALRDAAAEVTGLHGLYLVDRNGVVWRIAGSSGGLAAGRFEAPRAPVALPIGTGASGRHLATALAPASGGRFVIAQIDAEPLFARVAGLQRLIAGLVIAAGLIGVVLALLIARGIVRELSANSALIEAIRADAPSSDADGFRIRETRDLALAVRLMRTSVSGRLARGRHELARRDRDRDEAASVAAYRETAFPPLSTTVCGAAVAVRMLGAAPAGAFYAVCVAGDRASLVLGECAGDTPASALAQALAARRVFEGEPASADRVERAQRAFGIERLELIEWSAAATPEPRVLALLDGDNATRAAAYVRHAAGLTPNEVLADLTSLLSSNGVAAAVASASAEGGEG